MAMTVTWRDDISSEEWDTHLANLGGHPLQSALWGEARREVDGIENRRWAAFVGEKPLLMARVETRRIPGLGKVAWIPKGPTTVIDPSITELHHHFLNKLKNEKYILVINDPYKQDVVALIDHGARKLYPQPRTIWINLKLGKEKLWENLHKKWQYKIKQARRLGVTIEESININDVAEFVSLCQGLQRRKKFVFRGSRDLVNFLLNNAKSKEIEAKFFLNRHRGALAVGVVVLRCGKTLHNMFSGVDRKVAQKSPAELAFQGIIEWAVDRGLEIYDLEGIDPEKNPGTYQFKSRMGGKEVTLPGKYAYPLNLRGNLALTVGRWLKRI